MNSSLMESRIFTVKSITQDGGCEKVEKLSLKDLRALPLSHISKVYLDIGVRVPDQLYVYGERYLAIKEDSKWAKQPIGGSSEGVYGKVVTQTDIPIVAKHMKETISSDNCISAVDMVLTHIVTRNNLFSVYSLVSSPTAVGFTMPRYTSDLFAYMRKPRPAHVVDNIIKMVAGRLIEYSACNLLHRDVKPCNILVNLDEKSNITDVRVCDWGLGYYDPFSNIRGKPRGYCVQSIQFRSPEVIYKRYYTDKIDVWSFGCVIFWMLSGRYFSDARNIGEFTNDLAKIFGSYLTSGRALPVLPRAIADVCDSRYHKLLLMCLQPCPDHRSSWNEIRIFFKLPLPQKPCPLPEFSNLYDRCGRIMLEEAVYLSKSSFSYGIRAFILAHARELGLRNTDKGFIAIMYMASVMIEDRLIHGKEVGEEPFRHTLDAMKYAFIKYHPCLTTNNERFHFRMWMMAIDSYPNDILEWATEKKMSRENDDALLGLISRYVKEMGDDLHEKDEKMIQIELEKIEKNREIDYNESFLEETKGSPCPTLTKKCDSSTGTSSLPPSSTTSPEKKSSSTEAPTAQPTPSSMIAKPGTSRSSALALRC
jgi:serine/threonine protein kinase